MKLEILSECPDFLRDFLTYNETIKGKSSRSVEGYYIDLRTFFRFLLTERGLADGSSAEPSILSVDLPLLRTVQIDRAGADRFV